MLDSYKSPIRSLARFFESSRNKWKEKCEAAKKCLKRIKVRVRSLETSVDSLKARVRELESENMELRRRVPDIWETEASTSSPSKKKRGRS